MDFVWGAFLTDQCVQEGIISQLSRNLLQRVGLIYM